MKNLISFLKKYKEEFVEGYNGQKEITENILSEYGSYVFQNREKLVYFFNSSENSKFKKYGIEAYNFTHTPKTCETNFFIVNYILSHPGIF
ncbi:hypothetical protein GW931_02635 [archaeon]|nr:hypothetical protein [archaeon]